jgi:hypothetical protein
MSHLNKIFILIRKLLRNLKLSGEILPDFYDFLRFAFTLRVARQDLEAGVVQQQQTTNHSAPITYCRTRLILRGPSKLVYYVVIRTLS